MNTEIAADNVYTFITLSGNIHLRNIGFVLFSCNKVCLL